MRLRNVKGSREMIAVNEFVVPEDADVKGQWKSVFQNDHKIYVEIGMGKGRFIMDMARLHPENNYIGIEKYSSVLVRGLEKQQEEQLPNVRFMRMDAEQLCDYFAPGEIADIYLNFSDPWPKDRHAKRRLTSVQFLRRYEQVLAEGGGITFKTDNRPLFDFSVEQIAEAGWKTEALTYDLHHSEYAEGNVMTEYEERFSSQGNLINMFRAKP